MTIVESVKEAVGLGQTCTNPILPLSVIWGSFPHPEFPTDQKPTQLAPRPLEKPCPKQEYLWRTVIAALVSSSL